MLKNYILIAWRNFAKHSSFSFINIIGFALAMASCFLIIFHIRSETSYEKFYPGYENIYRVHVPTWAKSSPPLYQAMKDFFPEIKSGARFFEWGSGNILEYKDFQTRVGSTFMADSSAIDMFNYQFVEGSAKASLRAPFTAVISESLAKRVFGNEEAVGKTIRVNGDTEYAITGVVKDMPENTHIRFEMLVGFSTFYKVIPENRTSNRGWMAPYTYFYVQPCQIGQLVNKMGEFQVKFYENWDTPENLRTRGMLEMQPLKDIHLQSHAEQEMGENSNAS